MTAMKGGPTWLRACLSHRSWLSARTTTFSAGRAMVVMRKVNARMPLEVDDDAMRFLRRASSHRPSMSAGHRSLVTRTTNLLERLFRRGYRRLKTGPSALLYSSNSTQEPTSSADKRLDLAAGWAILLSAGGFSRRWIS